MAIRSDADTSRLDDAARAGWLYYVAGNTQDEIARKLGISRQTAQRLVSLAVSEKLVKVRLDHPIARCMSLARALQEAYELTSCEVVPSDPASTSTTLGIAEAAAAAMERYLVPTEPKIMAVGTGRSLRAAVEQVSPRNCPDHRIVSLVGNIAPDGSASFYDVISRLADIVQAPHYPMPVPVITADALALKLYHGQESVRNVLSMAANADVTFVGIGQLGDEAPLVLDGFMSPKEMHEVEAAGAVAEIVSWVFDVDGRLIEGLSNDRVSSAPLQPGRQQPVIGVAMGKAKAAGIAGAMRGKLINGLITDEHTAEILLR